LSGFNVGGRYLTVLYFQPHKFERKAMMEEKEKELEELRKRVQQRKTSQKGS
jgi:pre-mRNA branch site protein p14